MMKYRLVCSEGHEFEGWFRSSAAYDEQEARGQISCPHCGTTSVSKAIMAPHVATSASAPKEALAACPACDARTSEAHRLHAIMRELRTAITSNAEYVGSRFAEEARKIHYEENDARGVYGEASPDEVKALSDEGVPILPLPRLREDLN
jgi:hypothetical protein